MMNAVGSPEKTYSIKGKAVQIKEDHFQSKSKN